MAKSWDSSERWYTSCVGEKGHYYHQAVVLPNVFRLLGKKGSLLDLGCGQGVLARHLYQSNLKNRKFGPEGPQNSQSERAILAERQDTSENAIFETNSMQPKGEYWGVDQSKELIGAAKRMTQGGHFVVGDVTKEIPIEKKDFDRACFILSLQNMENGAGAIGTAGRHLRQGGKLLIVLNHPCFRIPRQSGWGVDEQMKLQYRRMNSYLSQQSIPIQTNPGKGKDSDLTFSYHHPLSDYALWLQKEKFAILTMEEWISDKKSEGAKAKMEDRARKEFPLFLAILAQRL